MALIDKASLLMVPSTYEAGTLYNVLPSGNRAPDSTDQNSGYDQTRADFTFDRGSNAAATRIGSDGLIEKYRENLYTESNNFSDSDWSPRAGTFAKGVTDPNGGTDAWSWTATNTDPYLYQAKNFTGVHCLSIYVKGVGSTIGEDFQIRVGTNTKDVALTGDWQRVQHFGVLSGSVNIGFEYGNPATPNDVVHIYAAQLEVGTIATDVLTSGATTAKAGVLIDLPRINYDANGENGSLLLEPSRQQLVPYSELFSTAVGWSPQVVGSSTANVILNYGISPDGYQNADRLQLALNGSSYADWVSVLSVASGTTYTYSVYAKSLSGNVDVKILGGTPTGNILKEITTEWTRLTHTFTATSTALYPRFLLEGGTSSSADILVFGAMLEAGSYATSYIPNHGTSSGVTRAADVCNGAGDASTFNDSEGVLYAEIKALSETGGNRYISLSDGTDSNRVILRFQDTDKVGCYVRSASGTDADITKTSASISSNFLKVAVKWKTNDVALWVNGVEVGTDSSFTTFNANVLDELNLTGTNGTSQYFHGNVKQVSVFDEALSDSELATLTTL